MIGNSEIRALTFDLFGTVLDLDSSLEQPIKEFLTSVEAEVSTAQFWLDWRGRQRLEQYQDTIMMLGHSGYLETVRRALYYVAAMHRVRAKESEFRRLMDGWWNLSPFPDVLPALERMAGDYRLVVLSNGEPHYLEYLVNQRLGFEFADIFSVSTVGAFKPHPSVYRGAAMRLGVELNQCMMVSANSFDVIGARACGMHAA
jgi:2-haloacid dehalogenase